MGINSKELVNAVFNDLENVNNSNPNERLPKEEQIRCTIFHYLLDKIDIVCAERGYGSIDNGNKKECDIWAKKGKEEIWLELKTCRLGSSKHWKNKPSEELKKWNDDIDKLGHVNKKTDRYFFLVCFSEFVSIDNKLQNSKTVNNINRLCKYLKPATYSMSFKWREKEYGNISCVCAWLWHWPKGIKKQVKA